uniref:Putative reverse transcriptase, maturase and HNH endonuclease n=1 Tax=Hafniomonas laevis TaxID=436124 RepID=A0A0S2LPH6_9CHLO|nr:putative reverse transcriptase, maturase and HNH endonuclease [Hafniomonas laevis]ALO63097.1 putative reverse transcriptase, maturase and HNH endonuclease [Hafniomonas laevis]
MARKKRVISQEKWDEVEALKPEFEKALEPLTILWKIGKEDPNYKFNNLMSIITDETYLINAMGTVMGNKSALTEGPDSITSDAASLNTIKEISESLKAGTFRFKPIRRIYIDKTGQKRNVNKEICKLAKEGNLTPEAVKAIKARPLGIPSFTDKIVQEAIRLVLDAIYEPLFLQLNCNFGFRKGHGCHDAIYNTFLKAKSMNFAIEADITGAFDNVDFEILMNILRKKIADEKFLKLILGGLKCGILFQNNIEDSKVGTTQGSLVSPLLFNIYFHEFDIYINSTVKEKIEHINVSEKRIATPRHNGRFAVARRKYRLNVADYQKADQTAFLKYGKNSQEFLKTHNKYLEVRQNFFELDRLQRSLPTYNYRKQLIRWYYVRYADDWIFFTNGPTELVKELKSEFASWLKENLKLTLSETKTKITNLYKDKCHFLGFQFRHSNTQRLQLVGKFKKTNLKIMDKTKKSVEKIEEPENIKKSLTTNPSLIFAFDRERVLNKFITSRFIKKEKGNYFGKSKSEWTTLEIPEIINRFNYVIRGYANYYGPMTYYPNDIQVLHYYLQYSCIHTIANKLNLSTRGVMKKFGKNVSITYEAITEKRSKDGSTYTETSQKTVKLLTWKETQDIIAAAVQFVKRQASEMSKKPNTPLTSSFMLRKNEDNLTRYKVNWRTKYKLSKYCAICGSTEDIEYHHVKHIKVGKVEGFLQVMKQLNRKQIPCCRKCHMKIHKGEYDGMALSDLYDEELIII